MGETKDTKKNTMKPLIELTLLDRFLFAQTMEDRESLQLMLSIILEEDIVLTGHPQTEKEIRTAPWLRSIRLDVYTMDDDERVYNAEVQKRNTGNLIKRSRFYQAMIDSSLLAPGEIDFNNMRPSYLITIMPFDLWGQGLYKYTFKMRCQEEEDIFSMRIKELHRRVSEIKSSEEIGVKYMQEWEERAYERREAWSEGKQEGRAEGRGEGREEGIRALILDNLEDGKTETQILDKLERRFSLDKERAKEYFDRYFLNE